MRKFIRVLNVNGINFPYCRVTFCEVILCNSKEENITYSELIDKNNEKYLCVFELGEKDITKIPTIDEGTKLFKIPNQVFLYSYDSGIIGNNKDLISEYETKFMDG